MFAITVDFSIKPEHREAFMQGMLANAKASLEREEGCLQFDVCVSTENDCHVFLYEIYRHKEDFDAHLKTEHFIEFNAASAAQFASKTVYSFERAAF
ncbi:MAG: antibiotic biosynthesis monooxygenase [Brachymonas sp.]|nr:antibiotic biosynthesis monooxygenase [Brachymonas sp.]